MINILYIAASGDLSGGGPISLLALLKKIDSQRFRPIVVCPSRGTLVDALESLNIKVNIIRIGSIRKFHIFSFIASLVKLSRMIMEEEVSIVHSNAVYSKESLCGLVSARINNIPFIYHARVLDPISFMEKVLASFCTKVVVISDAVAERFSYIKNKEKIVKIYNGVDLEEFDPNIDYGLLRKELDIKPATAIVATAGELASHKGIHYFLKSMPEIIKECPDVKFLIVGETSAISKGYKEELRILVDSLKINEKVIFTGFRKDFARVLRDIDVFVLLSGRESFGRVLIEAMAMEKPTVAARIGGIKEVVEDNVTGILVLHSDIEAVSRAIVSLLKDTKRTKVMGQAGRNRVKALFDINENVKRTERLYKDLV
ncbi:MAG: glycosyltransferase family 4 protein [Candidatus Omnitrophota bacterium]